MSILLVNPCAVSGTFSNVQVSNYRCLFLVETTKVNLSAYDRPPSRVVGIPPVVLTHTVTTPPADRRYILTTADNIDQTGEGPNVQLLRK